MATYAPLWVKSHHSFLEGASSPEELVDTAAEHGLGTVALTDRAGVYGMVRAHVRAKERGDVRLLVGAELQVREGPGAETTEVGRLVLLPTDRAAYGRMCRLLTWAHRRGAKGEAWTHRAELVHDADTRGLVALSADLALLPALRDAFEDAHAFVGRHLVAGERAHEQRVRAVAARLGLGVVGGNQVLYHHAARRDLQDAVTCVREGVTLGRAGTRLRPNAEHALLDARTMRARFRDAPELLDNSLAIAARCRFSLDQLRYRYPEESLPAGETEQSWLRVRTMEGAKRRYPRGVPDTVVVQLERELGVIETLEYGGYFLTMVEIVDFCRAEGILCQGRGSAANSAVCFCLGITAIDPVRMELLFERFLSVERAEPPDIDLDIEHERREEVIQHVYECYGRRRAAMVANCIRYRSKSAVREMGKALGVPDTDLDALSRLLPHFYFGGDEGESSLAAKNLAEEAGLDPKAPATLHLVRLALELQDAPRHLSIHPGGFLLGDVPVDELVPVEPATMEGRTVIQWDKYDVENLALFKVDLLGLGALTCIRKAFGLLSEHEDLDLEIATVPPEDPLTYDMVSQGDTVGVFQIESRAQMAMLPRLRPRTFYDLVIEVAIVRPGPIQGDMVHPYLRRRHGEERVEYPHPKLERVLRKTLGVPIFQEQVMKVAVAVADYTPGEADQLRRDMAAWRSSGKIERHYERMIGAMVGNGIPKDFAERVFSQIRGFGEYGFPESHAASFALLAYVTAWLRCHHPAVFTCALLNSLPMGFYSAATLVEDVKRRGVRVRPVDVRQSGYDHRLVRGERGELELQMGLRLIKGLSEADGEAIETLQRSPLGVASLEHLVRATSIREPVLVSLAEAGALLPLVPTRRDALWQIRALVKARRDGLASTAAGSQLSFAALGQDEAVLWDYRASRHSARGHPIARFRPALERRGIPSARDLERAKDGERIDYVGLVICRQRPMTASGVTFMTLEDESGFANLVFWKQSFDAHSVLLKTAVVLGVTAKVQRANGVIHLIVERAWQPPPELQPKAEELSHRSRDFH